MSVVNCCLIFVEGTADKAVRVSRQPRALALLRPPLNAHTVLFRQVVASLLVSVVLLGFKLSALKRLVQVNQRRAELQAALELLQPKVDAEKLAGWLADVEHDAKQRKDRIVAMDSVAAFDMLEAELLEKGAGMFAVFEASSAGTKQLEHSPLVTCSETKLDEATGLLLGRATAIVRATPQEIVAYGLDYDGRFIQSNRDPAVFIRCEVVEHVNAHHTIIFNRLKLGTALSQRTLLNSIIAKRVADDPPTYLSVSLPIARHDKITPKDEKGAVRAENCRAFKLTEVGAGITKLEYACSLNLCGSIPQAIANKVSVSERMNGAPPERLPHPSTPARPVCFSRTPYMLSRKRCASAHGCGLMQRQRRCSGTSSRFCRSQSATPATAASSASCSSISRAATRRIRLVRSAISRTARRCFATAVSHTSVKCSRSCSAPMCKVGRTTIRRPFPLHQSRLHGPTSQH
jgi:hypothetical protein